MDSLTAEPEAPPVPCAPASTRPAGVHVCAGGNFCTQCGRLLVATCNGCDRPLGLLPVSPPGVPGACPVCCQRNGRAATVTVRDGAALCGLCDVPTDGGFCPNGDWFEGPAPTLHLVPAPASWTAAPVALSEAAVGKEQQRQADMLEVEDEMADCVRSPGFAMVMQDDQGSAVRP
ncbi:MAG TPA: hypothetical protein VGO93_09140 [Candidatus Xenobia bacterium]